MYWCEKMIDTFNVFKEIQSYEKKNKKNGEVWDTKTYNNLKIQAC